jgi:hypothetical protein
LHRSDNQELARELVARIREKKGVPLLVLTKARVNEDERMTVMLNVVPVAAGTRPVEALEDQSRKLTVALHEWELLDGPSPLTRSGISGAEMTDRHLLRTREGRESAVRQTMRLFVRGAQGVFVSVMWQESRAQRPPEATGMLEALEFYAPSSKH